MTDVLSGNRPLKTVFCVLYFINTIAILGFSGLRMPDFPLNFAQVTGILLIILCFIIDNKIFWDKYQLLYWLFVSFFALSSLYTGYENDFLSTLLNTIFRVVCAYWSTRILLRDYKLLWPLLIPVGFMAAIDTVITIFQCFGYHQLDFILSMLDVNNEEKVAYMERRNVTFGLSLNGLFPNPVMNGHYLLFMFVTLLACIKNKLFSLRTIVPIIPLAGLFFCQQRSAFFLAIIVLVCYLYFLIKKGIIKKGIILLLAVLLAIIVISGDNFDRIISSNDYVSESRILSLEDTGRIEIIGNSIQFIGEHLLFGGHYLFMEETNLPPHNLILDAFISGGLIGGLILLVLIIKQMHLGACATRSRYSLKCIVFGLCFFSMIGDAMFHNSGYTSGDSVVWISWALLFSQYENETLSYRQNNQ